VVEHPHDKTFVALPGGHLEWGEDLKADKVVSDEVRYYKE